MTTIACARCGTERDIECIDDCECCGYISLKTYCKRNMAPVIEEWRQDKRRAKEMNFLKSFAVWLDRIHCKIRRH